jgi:hypothetical protein
MKLAAGAYIGQYPKGEQKTVCFSVWRGVGALPVDEKPACLDVVRVVFVGSTGGSPTYAGGVALEENRRGRVISWVSSAREEFSMGVALKAKLVRSLSGEGFVVPPLATVLMSANYAHVYMRAVSPRARPIESIFPCGVGDIAGGMAAGGGV